MDYQCESKNDISKANTMWGKTSCVCWCINPMNIEATFTDVAI